MQLIPAAISIWVGCWSASAAAPPAPRGDFLYTEAPRFEPQAAFSGGERFPAGARLMIHARGAARPLVPGFAASADASVSFDATRVLFAGRKQPGDPWRIWEIPIAGGVPRPITAGDEDCVLPRYLPLQKVVYARRTPGGFQIEVAPVAGGAPARLTFAPGNFLPAAVLRDGRILFEAAYRSAAVDLFTVYSDGTGVESYRCDHGPVRHSAAQVAPGDIVFQSANGLGRFTSARAVQVDLKLPAADYFGPVAEAAGRWLVSCRTAGGAAPAICAVTPDSPQPPAAVARGGDGAGAWQPATAAPRPVPPYHPSSLGDFGGANLLCLDAHASRAGRLPQGAIAKVRLWSRTPAGDAVVLGDTEVDPDGSFFVQVPAERPLRFELLDRNGRTLRAQKSWFWTRKGEQRVCVGCHTGPERAPDNVAPGVLLRTQVPVRLGAGTISMGAR